MKIKLTICLGLLSFWAPAFADDAGALVVTADATYAKRDDLSEAKNALAAYERAAAMKSTAAAEAGWKASRAAWWMAEHSDKRADRLAYYQEGINNAQQALAVDANAVAAHFWLGCNQGSFGDTKGVMKSLSLVKPIRHEMQEVIRLDDHFSGGGAWRVLGVVDYKVPGMMGGSKKRAEEELRKALALGPQDPFNHFFMAEYYKTVGEKTKKDQEIAALRAIPPSGDLAPEIRMMQKRAESL